VIHQASEIYGWSAVSLERVEPKESALSLELSNLLEIVEEEHVDLDRHEDRDLAVRIGTDGRHTSSNVISNPMALGSAVAHYDRGATASRSSSSARYDTRVSIVVVVVE